MPEEERRGAASDKEEEEEEKKEDERKYGGDVAQLVEHPTITPLTQVQFPSAARDFSPRVNVQCRLSYGVHTALMYNHMI